MYISLYVFKILFPRLTSKLRTVQSLKADEAGADTYLNIPHLRDSGNSPFLPDILNLLKT